MSVRHSTQMGMLPMQGLHSFVVFVCLIGPKLLELQGLTEPSGASSRQVCFDFGGLLRAILCCSS